MFKLTKKKNLILLRSLKALETHNIKNNFFIVQLYSQ